MKVTIVLPTYNEAATLEQMVAALLALPLAGLSVLVVDDNSPDGTGEVAEKLTQTFPIQVVHRSGKLGLGSAVMAGFARSNRPLLGVIDADLSHDPAILPQLIRGLKTHDLMIGSRYNPESRVEKWPWYRKVISQTGVFLARQLTGVQDPLAGYFFLHRGVIDGMSLTSPGYKILLEILVKGHYERFMEVPFVFRNREFSSSKLNWTEYYLFAKQLLTFWLFKQRTHRHL